MERFISKNLLRYIVIVFFIGLLLQTWMTIKENRKIERNIVQEYSNLLSQYAL